ncbi:SDR family oxidoreductase [Saccharopolyspora hordei]|uniref:NAD(P)-dependent dehydrogenase (Short-subunit alcohol dehydrogenase family) n=1 Tax=Saccharopolyspora hordei TaxID=1838 RepID=A0A853AUS7_9PSEU|nr:SDR family oxidoreductase [Saccharopolyspora hordei]NYI86399.1 NAD(P)-dependent dehydrogenase (short-subunit alcohol dehydrogenase family) [Saccharopolyspora hordei]
MLVTGGASGIGRAIAEEGLARGWDVVVIDREAAPVGTGVKADLADADSTRAALEEALAAGPITRLVNNVGAVFPGALQEQSLAEVDAAYQLNLRCAVQCAQALLPGMTQAGFGRIVNMASRAALGKELRTAYAASKAGLIGLTRVWALELGPLGITVNAIGPGPIATELFAKANDEERTRQIVEAVPVRRMGTPDDIAHSAGYFLDERAGFVTGQTVYVCGGLTVGVAQV